MEKFSLGIKKFDDMTKGGLEYNIINNIYGPAASGKTLFCILSAINFIKNNDKKILYIDTENGFSIERLNQIINQDTKKKDILKNIIIFKPNTLDKLDKTLENSTKINKKNIGMIIVDSISMLYRLELGKFEINKTNKIFAKIISNLMEISKNNVAILLTSHIYADFNHKNETKMSGGDFLKYSCKALFKLENLKNQIRKLTIIKHRSLKEEENLYFKIIKEGIKVLDAQEYFSI